MRLVHVEAAALALLAVVAGCRSDDAAETSKAGPPAADDAPQESVASDPTAVPGTHEQMAAVPIVPADSGRSEAGDGSTAAVAAVPLLPGGAASSSGGAPGAVPLDSRSARVAAITAEFDAAMQSFYDVFRGAESEEELQELASTLQPPDSGPAVAALRAIVEESPDDDAAFTALTWIVEQPGVDDATSGWCVAQLGAHHADRAEIANSLQSLAYSAAPGSDALLERLATDSPHREVRGLATMAAAEALAQSLEMAEYVRGLSTEEEREEAQQYMSATEFERLASLDRGEFEARIAALYERVVADYGDVVRYDEPIGPSATAALRELRDLKVGKLAPDIVGEDIGGTAFKLSDYRGQVVMLDFWGNW
ncbi:MAG: hypothetical protein R3F34_17180 [Planctomycetota bacterium]